MRSNYEAEQSPGRSRSHSPASSSSPSSDSDTPVKKRRGAVGKKVAEAKKSEKGKPKNHEPPTRNLSAFSSNRGRADNISASRGSEGNQTLTSFLQMGFSKVNTTQAKKQSGKDK